jgi:hypothetical protein
MPNLPTFSCHLLTRHCHALCRSKVNGQPLKNKKATYHAWMLPTQLRIKDSATEAEEAESPMRTTPQRRRVAPEEAESDSVDAEDDAEAALPSRATHERARMMPQKPNAPVRGRQKAVRATPETKVPLVERLKQFPGTSLSIIAGKLHCMCCKYSCPNKWSTIDGHMKRRKHAKNYVAWRLRSVDDDELKTVLIEYYTGHPDEANTCLQNPNEMIFRYRTTETFLASGVALNVCDMMRPLLERTGLSLTSSTHLKVYVPKIESAEFALLEEEMREQYISVSFDGTTRLGEAINTTARWCPSTFDLQVRLIDFSTMEKHLSGKELAIHEQDLIMRRRAIPPSHLVNISRDSCATNGVACRALVERPFTNSCDMMCISHTFSNCGKRIVLPTLDKFRTPWLELAGGRDPVPGAKQAWKLIVYPAEVPGYSSVRWWAWAEITFTIAEAGMCRLGDFITTCEDREFGNATTASLRNIYDNELDKLRLEFAAMLDIRILVKTTYELEGDRLEILLTFERTESLRALGRAIKSEDDGCLPNVDATLRKLMKLKKDMVIEKYYAGHGVCKGKLVKTEKVASTLYPGQQRDAWKVKYISDGQEEHFEEEELRSGSDGPAPAGGDGKPTLVVRNLPERTRMCQSLVPCFNYLEARLTGITVGASECQDQYSCVKMYEICRVIRAFNPNFAAVHVDAAFVDSMAAITPLNGLGMLTGMKSELPLYLAAAQGAPIFDKSSVNDFTDTMLMWWRTNGKSFPAWALAARVAFAISPNSAACERVFALVKQMFGEQQMSTLKDLLQAALMLRSNKRRVG